MLQTLRYNTLSSGLSALMFYKRMKLDGLVFYGSPYRLHACIDAARLLRVDVACNRCVA